jgi:hypothetical protein
MKRVVLSSFIALLIITCIAVSYFYFQQVKVHQVVALNAIPGDAAFIYECRNSPAAWKKLSATPIWKDVVALPFFKNIAQTIHVLDSAIQKSSNRNFFNESPVFISGHLNNDSQYDLLFLIGLPKMQQETFVNDLEDAVLKGRYKVKKETYNGVSLRKFQIEDGVLTLAVYKGVFMASFSPSLIEEGISQLKLGKPISSDTNFKQVYATAGNPAEGALYINYRLLPKLMLSYLNSPAKSPWLSGLNDLAHFSDWTGMDLQIKGEGLLLNGFSSASDSGNFLHIFEGIAPRPIELKKVLPQKTAFLMYMGIGNAMTYFKKYETYLSVNKNKAIYRKRIDEINNQLSFDVQMEMAKWIDNEIALVVTESGEADFKNHVFAIVKAKDSTAVKNCFIKINKALRKKDGNSNEEVYREHPIGFLDLPNLMPDLFGPVFGKIEKMFYTVIDGFVVFGNQASSIRKYIDDNADKKFLLKDHNYARLQSFLYEKTNLYVYVNIPGGMNLLQNMAAAKLSSAMEVNSNYFHKFNALAIQFRFQGTQVASSLYLQEALVSKNDLVGLLPMWDMDLDSTISTKPEFVINHKTASNEVLAQDDANQLYLLDSAGTILWKTAIEEPIMSSFYQVDAFKNKRLQYMFNTASFLYCIDRKGQNVEGFPIRLKYKATNGMAVFDYENNLDYRIYLAGDDNLIHCCQVNGKPVEGWKYSTKTSLVSQPVAYYKVAESDYLLITEKSGALTILDRKGKIKVNFKEPFSTEFRNPLFLVNGDDAGKAYWVSTDTAGSLVKIYLNGEVSVKKMKAYSSSHYFACADLDADGRMDYIFVDKNKLEVFTQEFSSLYSYTFKGTVYHRPVLCTLQDDKKAVGITVQKTGQLFLFDPDGTIHHGFPIKGNTPFSFKKGKEGTYLITSGDKDKKVLFYSFE